MVYYSATKYNKKTTNNYRHLRNLKVRRYGFGNFISPRLSYHIFTVSIPTNWDYLVLRKVTDGNYTIYLFNKTYYLKFGILHSHNHLSVDPNTSSISYRTFNINMYSCTYWLLLRQIFLVFNKPLFLKLRFRGKGYYLYKNNRHTITPQFGYSHRLYLYAYFVSVKFLSKTKVFIFGLLKSDIIRVGREIRLTRPINIFTGRGVRFARQVIYKKVGKVSSYR